MRTRWQVCETMCHAAKVWRAASAKKANARASDPIRLRMPPEQRKIKFQGVRRPRERMRHRKSISAKSVYRTGRGGERKVSGERERGREQGTGIMRQQKQMVPATLLSQPVLRARNKSKRSSLIQTDLGRFCCKGIQTHRRITNSQTP